MGGQVQACCAASLINSCPNSCAAKQRFHRALRVECDFGRCNGLSFGWGTALHCCQHAAAACKSNQAVRVSSNCVAPGPCACCLQDIADLCVALLGQPAATDTTFEVGSTVPFSQPWEGACRWQAWSLGLPSLVLSHLLAYLRWYKNGQCVIGHLRLQALLSSMHGQVPPTSAQASPCPLFLSWPAGGSSAQPRDWAALLQAADLKERVTGKTIGGRYLGKEPEPAQPGNARKVGATVA